MELKRYLPVLLYFSLQVLKGIIRILDCLLDKLSGFSLLKGSRKDRIQADQDYHRSAHRLRILFRIRFYNLQVPDLSNFLVLHDDYLDPGCILKDPSIVLTNVTRDYALFSVIKPGVDIHDIRRYPFNVVANYEQAHKLIVLPINHFHKLAQEAGDPKALLAFIHMTARCGSTLLCQMVFNQPGTRVLSEPFALVNVNRMHQLRQTSIAENRQLVQSALRIQLKIEPEAAVAKILVKFSGLNTCQIRLVKEFMPHAKMIFNARMPMPCIRSTVKLSNVETQAWYASFKWGHRLFFSMFPFPYDGERFQAFQEHLLVSPKNLFDGENGALHYALTLVNYLRSKDLFDEIIVYEDLLANPGQELAKLARLMDFSLDNIPSMLEALKIDSQNDVLCQRGRVEDDSDNDQTWQRIDQLWQTFDLPLRLDTSLDDFRQLLGFLD